MKKKLSIQKTNLIASTQTSKTFGNRGRIVQKPTNIKVTMKRLFKNLGEWKWPIIVGIFFTLIQTVLSVIGPTYLKELTNIIQTFAFAKAAGGSGIGPYYDDIMFYGFLLAGLYLVSFLSGFVANFILAKTNQKISFSLRTKIIYKINNMPLKYFDSHQSGDVLSRITNDTTNISKGLSQSLSQIFQAFIMLFGVTIAMFVVSWQMGLTVIAILPIAMVLFPIVAKLRQGHAVAMQENLGILNSHVEESFTGHNIIKAFNNTKITCEEFERKNKKLSRSNFFADFFMQLFFPIGNLIQFLSMAAVYTVGIILIINNVITFGVMISFIIYANLFQQPFQQFAQIIGSMQTALAGAERVYNFLDEENQTPERPKLQKLDRKKLRGEVEFDHVRFGYNPNKIIIKDFSLHVKPGQKIAIVGPTGAGKTTIVNLIMRFYEINHGAIKIDGIDTRDLSRSDVRKLFGMVLQDTWLFEGTVRENIAYVTNATDRQIVQAAKESYVHHFIKTLPHGYNTKLDDNTSVSAGERQLLTIARAMVQNSPMLILDEATSSVDTRTEILIQNAMDKLAKGRTSFVIAHRLSTIRNADVILVLKAGDVVEQGSHEQLLAKNGIYAELYNSQFSEEQE